MSKSVLEVFYYWEKTTPANIFLRQAIHGMWKTWTYREAGYEIRKIASALTSLHLPPESNVAILSKNCAHWIMADIAIWMSGHVSLPIYPSLSASSIGPCFPHAMYCLAEEDICRRGFFPIVEYLKHRFAHRSKKLRHKSLLYSIYPQ